MGIDVNLGPLNIKIGSNHGSDAVGNDAQSGTLTDEQVWKKIDENAEEIKKLKDDAKIDIINNDNFTTASDASKKAVADLLGVPVDKLTQDQYHAFRDVVIENNNKNVQEVLASKEASKLTEEEKKLVALAEQTKTTSYEQKNQNVSNEVPPSGKIQY